VQNINPVLKFKAKKQVSILGAILVFWNILVRTHNRCNSNPILQIEYKYCGKQSYVYGKNTATDIRHWRSENLVFRNST